MFKNIICLILLFAYFGATKAQIKIPGDSVIRKEIYSTILNEYREIIIHFPFNYEKNRTKRYPVMYILDGSSQDQHTTDKILILSHAEVIPECIVVGIPNSRGNRNRDQTPPFMQTETDGSSSVLGQADKFLSFIEMELIPHIDSNFRSSGYNAISGNSRGGLFVLYTLIVKPQLFKARFCYSTPVWRFNDLLINKLQLFLKTKHRYPNSFLVIAVGGDETENIKGGNQRMAVILNATNAGWLKWKYFITSHSDHQTNAFLSTPKALAEWGKFLTINQ